MYAYTDHDDHLQLLGVYMPHITGQKNVTIRSHHPVDGNNVFLYYGAKIYTCEHQKVFTCGYLVVYQEKIIAVGKWNQNQPQEQQSIKEKVGVLIKQNQAKELKWIEIDCQGEHITPGLIDAHAHMGLYPEGFIGEPKDLNELTQAVTPQLDAFDGIWPGDIAFSKAVRGGVTTVCILPGSANVIGGTGIVMKTYGNDVNHMTLRRPACLKIAFGYNVKHNHGKKGRTPLTRMGLTDLLRHNFDEALHYEEQKLLNPHTRTHRGYENILLALQRKIPVRAHASRSDDILTAIRLSQEYGFQLVVEHAYEAIHVIEQLQSVQAHIVYGPAFRTCGHSEDLNFDFVHTKILLEAGVKVAHMTDHPIVPIQYLSLQAGLCVREGVEELQALELITASAAEILGCDHKIGRLKEGLDADFVRFNGPPLEVASRVVATYIQGHQVYTDSSMAPHSIYHGKI